MAHALQKDFCKRTKLRFPEYFKNKKVLDCGSYDVNGNNRLLFDECDYTGIDLMAGPNVDVISRIHEYLLDESELYDTIISTECFEHDKYFQNSIERIVGLLRPNGLFLFTCATDGRPEHGTIQHSPESSPGTIKAGDGWERYYRTISAREGLEIGLQYFNKFLIEVDKEARDLYFWGIK